MMQEATTCDLAMSSPVTGALDLVRAGTVSEKKRWADVSFGL